MSEAVFRRESAVEYFKELVDGALAHQRLATRRADRVLRRAAAHRLSAAAGRRRRRPEPLALRLAQALDSGGVRQRASLRQIGDVSLFISGFFSDSLRRKLVDVDYYVSIGGCAYNALSRVETDTFSPVFAELAEKFVGFVDVLSEVSERTSCSSNADLLRLYERWLKTGSRRSGQLLVERGVVPNASIKIDPHPIGRPSVSARVCAQSLSQVRHTSAFLLHTCRLHQRTEIHYFRSEPSAPDQASKGSSDLNKRSTHMGC